MLERKTITSITSVPQNSQNENFHDLVVRHKWDISAARLVPSRAHPLVGCLLGSDFPEHPLLEDGSMYLRLQ
jgi:hypothetical protein